MEHSSTRDLLQKSVSSPKQKGLTEIEMKKSSPVKVDFCDDFFKIYLEIKNEIITKSRWEGTGCAISIASIDVLFNLIENKHIHEVNNIIDIYEKFLNGETETTGYDILDHFKIIQNHKSRIKCASVSFKTIRKDFIKNG